MSTFKDLVHRVND